MKSARRWLVFLAGALLVGCDSSVPTESVQQPSLGASWVLASGQPRATGHAVLLVPDPTPTFPLQTKLEEYSFSALTTGRVPGPGTPVDAKGQMEFRSHRADLGTIRVHAEVVCVGVDEGATHRARIAAVVRQSSNLTHFPLASGLIFSVTDNGEGAHSPPDQAGSPLTILGADETVVRNQLRAFCQFGGFPPEFPTLRGNIQVKMQG